MYQFGTILFLVFVISYHFHASHNFHEMHLTGIIKRFRILQILITMQFGDTLQTCSTFQLKNKQIQVESVCVCVCVWGGGGGGGGGGCCCPTAKVWYVRVTNVCFFTLI